MDKMRMETPDLSAENVEKIAALFPSCVTEMADENGRLKKAINFDLLRQMLSSDVVEGEEAFEFTWIGKKAAIVEANKPIRKTLRPCPEESADWDTTENLYIEGDNLEVLKLLQESYLSKIKMIYIDPPYNTGHDFVYPDSFIMDNEDYNDGVGYFDEDGNVNFARENNTGAAKYHSDWCSMMYSRLTLARNLLSEDGIIFISIDDNEINNLRKICDEIFGESNFVNQVIWVRNSSGKTVSKQLTQNIEYLLIYSKSENYELNPVYKPLSDATKKLYSKDDHDGRGKYRLYPLQKPASPGPETTYDYIDNTGKVWKCPPKGWRMKQSKLKALENDGRLYMEGNSLSEKAYWNERAFEGRLADTYWDDMPENSVGTKEVSSLFDGQVVFSNPKPVEYLIRMIKAQTSKDEGAIILDFFSGSATTAHAVMSMNNQDSGNRKFIMVQLPEQCDEKSLAYKNGYTNICDIGKERIRRAGKSIKDKNPLTTMGLDTGFRVFRLDDSNMNDVYYAAGDYSQDMLTMLESNVKSDRTDLDLLFGCLLEWGLPLSMPYNSEKIGGCTVHTYNDGDLIACFDENIPDTVIKEIARRQPLRAVFRDSSFNGSPAKINVGEIFKMLAPDTRVKVI